MNMKLTTLAAALLCGLNLIAETSTPKGFTDDLDAALKSAKDNNKLVYVCFSGSDWCHWCIKLEQEVFSDDTFASSLKDDYELVFIDSPMNKERLSDHAKSANEALTKKYKVRGFPTFVILKSDGTMLTHEGAYRPGGAKPYIEMLEKIADDPAEYLRQKEEAARLQKLANDAIKPFDSRFVKIMDELNVECGKYMDAQAAKPENKAAGKTRDDFRDDCIVLVKARLHEFRALEKDARAAIESAPVEVRPAVKDYADRLDHWIKMIDPAQ